MPANDIGGGFDISDLATTGVDRVEVLRGTNSVLYGTDALSGVINITTSRGQTRIPAKRRFSVDGGNLGTVARRRVDWRRGRRASTTSPTFSHLQTDNSVPNNDYRNNTFASGSASSPARAPTSAARCAASTRRLRQPERIQLLRDRRRFVAGEDDHVHVDRGAVALVAAVDEHAALQRRRSGAITTSTRRRPASGPTRRRSPTILGNPVTISAATAHRHAAGRSSTTAATIRRPSTPASRGGCCTATPSSARRPSFDIAGGVRVENEHGASGTTSKTSRTNSGAFVEGARCRLRGHLYVNGGLGFDENDIFGHAWTPRVSVAAYLRQPSPTTALGDTKLTFNAGKGIKEPSLGQELSSLSRCAAATASALGIEPVGPERSRNVDVGIEQGLAGGRGRVRLAYFNNEFLDLIEFVSRSVLPQLGRARRRGRRRPASAPTSTRSRTSRAGSSCRARR